MGVVTEHLRGLIARQVADHGLDSIQLPKHLIESGSEHAKCLTDLRELLGLVGRHLPQSVECQAIGQLIVGFNLAADVLYGALDPRIKYT